jgi:ribulose-5-phosphate 4-epimerase/fuculose-1-phosphate aldolase
MNQVAVADSRATPDAEESAIRTDLAAAFQLAALHGWDEIVIAHLSARIRKNQFLMHPSHLYFSEVTASNLHLLDESGEHVVPNPEMPHRFAFPFHKGIYDAFPQANCVMHLHTPAATAVAMQKQGLIPGNQYALWLGPIGYHDYEGLVSTASEGERLGRSFGSGHVVLQRAHGFVVWGHSVPHAYLLAYFLNRACEVQIASQTGVGGIEPYVPSDDVVKACVPQAQKIMLDPNGPVVRTTWAGALRKLEKTNPSFRS